MWKIWYGKKKILLGYLFVLIIGLIIGFATLAECKQ